MENQKTEYYINRKRKVIDFLVGLVILPVLAALYLYLLTTVASWFPLEIDRIIIGGCMIIFVIFLCSLFLLRNRRFIGQGLMAAFAIPIIIAFGACFSLR